MSSELKALFDEQGYVIVPGLIPEGDLPRLKEACDRVISRTREGKWPYRRTVGKQFPPFDEKNPDSWGVQHVMHPDLGEPAFASWYTSDRLVETVQTLLVCDEKNLQMELFNLLINPETHDFALRWHRDDVNEKASEEEEREALKRWSHGIQWNTALYPDSCLFIVPGTHKTPRTPEQRVHSETAEAPEDPLSMPGCMQVTLQPGETVFYNSNILHCATYDSKQRRATLHASMGDIRGGSSRARNVLQHGLNWMREERFRLSLDVKSRPMLDRLLAMYNSAPDVGYSQLG